MTLLLATLLSAAALADPDPRSRLEASCGPLSAVLRDTPGQPDQGLDSLKRLAGPSSPALFVALLDLADEERARAAGLDPAGQVAVTMDLTARVAEVRLPLLDPARQAEPLVRGLDGQLRPEGEAWHLSWGREEAWAGLDGNTLVVRYPAQGPALSPHPPSRPGQALPEGDGCRLLAQLPDLQVVPPMDLALYSNLVDFTQVSSLYLQVEGFDPPRSFRRPRRPANPTTLSRPVAVLTLGVAPGELLALAPERGRAGAVVAELEEELGALDRVGPGVSVAVLGGLTPPVLAIAAPVRGPLRLPVRAKRLSAGLEEALAGTGVAVQRVDARTVRWEMSGPLGPTMTATTRLGWVYASNDPTEAAAMAEGEGTPWLDPGQARRLDGWAVGLQVFSGALTGWAGLGAQGPMWHAEAELTSTGTDSLLGQRLRAGLGASGGSLLRSALEAMPTPGPANVEEELERNLEGICIAELAYNAAFDQYVPLEAHPRPVPILSATPTAWAPAPESWELIGWQPEQPELQGTYWVTVAPDGATFRAWGMGILEDGSPIQRSASPETGCDSPIAH